MQKVYKVIRKLGITSKYKGYYYVADAVKLTMEFQNEPIKITKDIYPKLAKKYKSTTMNVEHDIRTAVTVGWLTQKEEMERIAGYPLAYKPTNREFVDMLVYYMMKTEV